MGRTSLLLSLFAMVEYICGGVLLAVMMLLLRRLEEEIDESVPRIVGFTTDLFVLLLQAMDTIVCPKSSY